MSEEEMNGDLIPSVDLSAESAVGAILKAAREAKGMSLQEASTRLRLMTRQIEAMETGDLASLGQPVFGRGFVRNYARMLELDEEPLLAKLSPAKAVVVTETESLPFTPKPDFWTSPWVMGLIGALILLVALPVVLYLWLNSGEEEPAPAQTETQAVQQPAAASVTPNTSTDVQPNMQADTGVSGENQPNATDTAQATMTSASVPVLPIQPTASQIPTVKPDSDVSAVAEVQAMQFNLAQPAWLQVRDSTGKMVYSALNAAGSHVEVKGVPPFDLVVGNAAHVELIYKNKPVDVKSHIDVSVARFTLD